MSKLMMDFFIVKISYIYLELPAKQSRKKPDNLLSGFKEIVRTKQVILPTKLFEHEGDFQLAPIQLNDLHL
jgi:hypothetical protein